MMLPDKKIYQVVSKAGLLHKVLIGKEQYLSYSVNFS
jgi:hypothetical protein